MIGLFPGNFDEKAFKKGFSRAFSDISRGIFNKRFEQVSPMEKKIMPGLSKSKPAAFSELIRNLN